MITSEIFLLLAIGIFFIVNIYFLIRLFRRYKKGTPSKDNIVNYRLENHDVKVEDAVKYFKLIDYFDEAKK